MNKLFTWTSIAALSVTGLLAGLTALPAQTGDQPAAPEQIKFFQTQVQPILKANCFACHGSKDGASGGLFLGSRAAIFKGGVSGSAVDLKNPAQSLLIRAINYQGRQMPPTGKLPQAQIEIITRWVQMGLPWSAGAEAPGTSPVRHGPPPVDAAAMNFWSFRPVKRPAVPAVKNAAWVRNPIDSFVLAKLEKADLTPAPPAGKAALLRRATYDLTGLPPTPDEVRAFLADPSPKAYERVVDRLLASPRYGEKWGRHWLDLVRYAESNSFERDDPKPFVWRYRDYVIRSFNADKPYDQFIREQLAGDEMDNPTNETLIATGYYRLGIWDDEPADPEQARYDELDDITATTGQVFLGLTVNCARCHDHKIDPIPQKDYYRLLAFFQGIRTYGIRSPESVAANSLRTISPADERRRFEIEDAAYKKRMAELNAPIEEIEKTVLPNLSDVEKEEFKYEARRIAIVRKRVPALLPEAKFQQYADLVKQRDDLRKSPPRGLEMALCVTETGPNVPQTCVLMRGNPHVKGDPVEPGFLSVMQPPKPVINTAKPEAQTSGRRLALARWIASEDNQLTARVMVNRIWQYHFGRGIVRSSSNFGYLGTAPTHPELLDWLASEFVRQGWSLKKMHRMIMLSNAYRMSSQSNPKALAKDPENDLLWRFDMRRLDAEEIRDSILAVNGSLNLKEMHGPSVYPEIPKEVLAGQSMPGHNWGKSTPEEQARRSIYVHIKRSLAVPILASFDAADTDFTCPVRFATTQPTQALSLMNSRFINDQAKVFADTLRKQAGPDPAAQVKLALWRTLQRAPTQREIDRGLRLMHSLKQEGVSPPDSLKYFCLVALNLNEFMYLD